MKTNLVDKAKTAVTILGLLATLVMVSEAIAAKVPPASPVDINKASVSELTSIPGVGPAKAEAIVAYRSAQPFATANDIVNVKGIGDKMYAKISQYITVNGQSAVVPGTAEKAAR
jgi:comEA protein